MQVLAQVEAGQLSLREGATLMAVSYRQAKRLRARYRAQGPAGLAHRPRGQPARNALAQALRERIVALRQQLYSQFNDQHFTEMLASGRGSGSAAKRCGDCCGKPGSVPSATAGHRSTAAGGLGAHSWGC